MSNGNDNAFPTQEFGESGRAISDLCGGLTKRELFAAVALHAEFLSCGSHRGSAEALADAAHMAGQSIEQRMAINALAVADAMLDELAKPATEQR